MPGTFEDVIELLIPELRRRGIFWDGYCVPGASYRENFYELPGQKEPLPSHPAAAMIWRSSREPESEAKVNGEHGRGEALKPEKKPEAKQAGKQDEKLGKKPEAKREENQGGHFTDWW